MPLKYDKNYRNVLLKKNFTYIEIEKIENVVNSKYAG